MNNKGFAISSMLYGILLIAVVAIFLILDIMASTNSNNNDLVRQIEKELNTCVSNESC